MSLFLLINSYGFSTSNPIYVDWSKLSSLIFFEYQYTGVANNTRSPSTTLVMAKPTVEAKEFFTMTDKTIGRRLVDKTFTYSKDKASSSKIEFTTSGDGPFLLFHLIFVSIILFYDSF